MIRAFVVDDEPLAVKRLARMLEETRRVEVAGTSTDPVDALAALGGQAPDVLFLDIQMPGMTGFEMLSLLDPQPLVVFTTAYDQYALQAFEVNSIDYLLKPVEERHLARALDKLERLRATPAPPPDWKSVLAQISAAVGAPASESHTPGATSLIGQLAVSAIRDPTGSTRESIRALSRRIAPDQQRRDLAAA